MKRSEERIEFLKDIIIIAVEGGIGYWSQVSAYRPDDGTVTIHVNTDDFVEGEVPESFDVDIDTVARGIGRIKDGDFQICKEYRRSILCGDAENDGGEIDAPTADCIIQAAMFGELVYG